MPVGLNTIDCLLILFRGRGHDVICINGSSDITNDYVEKLFKRSTSLLLGQLISRGLFRPYLIRGIVIDPRHAALYLLKVDVLTVERHLAKRAPVLVLLPACDRHRVAEDQIRKTLLRAAAEVLIDLWRVYAHKPHPVLTIIGVENRNRFAVAHAYNLAGDGLLLRSSR